MLLYAGAVVILMVAFYRFLDLLGLRHGKEGPLTRLGFFLGSLLVAVPASVPVAKTLYKLLTS
jgi:hypothetical protein